MILKDKALLTVINHARTICNWWSSTSYCWPELQSTTSHLINPGNVPANQDDDQSLYLSSVEACSQHCWVGSIKDTVTEQTEAIIPWCCWNHKAEQLNAVSYSLIVWPVDILAMPVMGLFPQFGFHGIADAVLTSRRYACYLVESARAWSKQHLQAYLYGPGYSLRSLQMPRTRHWCSHPCLHLNLGKLRRRIKHAVLHYLRHPGADSLLLLDVTERSLHREHE